MKKEISFRGMTLLCVLVLFNCPTTAMIVIMIIYLMIAVKVADR